ncbi:phenylethanolamine N-methyltransferase-like isoform X2 [Haliotis rubra]|uniref:phenylethanolamine N-methyltransferase-like isoform X2 n=1 Tax=Haliotis rubra TaxID=36100 RepID=UPI001EE59F03|nr:phenylethanolamine N-methyltransferase-like isoform X2 [Haliotis rubra]
MNKEKFGREDYLKYFDPVAFLKMYHSDIKGNQDEGDLMPWKMKNLHDVFAEGKLTGRRLLDIGTGPTIHSVISASNYCDTVYLSDFTPQNRETLRKWLDGSLQHSFKSFFQTSPSCREEELRKKICGILPIDLLLEEPLAPCYFPRFDMVTTSFCLDAVALDHVDYGLAAQKITNMLKIGGHLVVCGLHGSCGFKVGEHVFRSCHVSVEQVKDTWTRCGFDIVDWREQESDKTRRNTVSTFDGVFVMVAKRVR